MILRALLAASCFAAGACGGPTPPAFGETLVVRFDVPQCEDIEPLRMAGESLADGQKVTREYYADVECAEALRLTLASMDFERADESTYVARRDKDWTETVRFGPSRTDTRSNLTWEEINP